MIFFYGEGRLGNQILQYQALSQIAKPGECIFSVGMEDLHGLLELRGPRLVVLTRNWILKRITKYALRPLLLRPVARALRFFNYATETSYGAAPNEGASGEMSMHRGLLKSLTFVDGGYYQNAAFWPALFPTPLLQIKKALREAARSYLESISKAGLRPAFVHVRRGDYLTHTEYGLKDLALPVGYYRAAIGELESRVGPTHLVFVTDDQRWVEENFRDIAAKTIASFDAELDFGIMTECASGILSNSTFSLTAALMLRNPDVVIAPKYWLGFRVGAWYPPKMHYAHSKLIYIAADC